MRAAALFAAVFLAACSGSTFKPPVDARQWDGTPASAMTSHVSPRVGTRGMVVADDRIAAEWGAEILRRGGNAVDAAVATAFALAVTRPNYATLAGGGFMVFCPKPAPDPMPCQTIDYRERAPLKATRDMYLRDGKFVFKLSHAGALASGVPGTPAGLLLALEKWGTHSRKMLLSRPIELARNGFPFTGNLESQAADTWSTMNDEAKRLFGCRAGKELRPCPPGTVLRQRDLARVLGAISEKGRLGFYDGWVARKLVDGLAHAGGILSKEDLLEYKPVIRPPLAGRFGDWEVVTMPPPSSGGALLLQLLGYAERADHAGALGGGPGSASAIHALAHAMGLAFSDRAQYFGDPDFFKVPVASLLSADYLDHRFRSFDPNHANLPAQAGEIKGEPAHTTHFSVIDAEGNAVAITTTINDEYGSGFVPPGTGIVMNDEMDDFSAQPGVPNGFGLVGAEANAIAPEKRPLSSMTPTIVRDHAGNARIVIGAAGGPRIITSVFLSLVNRLRWGMSLPEAVAWPRFHEQWKPAVLKLERFGHSFETSAELAKLGYAVELTNHLAAVHALERFPNGRTWGVPDIRSEGAAVAE